MDPLTFAIMAAISAASQIPSFLQQRKMLHQEGKLLRARRRAFEAEVPRKQAELEDAQRLARIRLQEQLQARGLGMPSQSSIGTEAVQRQARQQEFARQRFAENVQLGRIGFRTASRKLRAAKRALRFAPLQSIAQVASFAIPELFPEKEEMKPATLPSPFLFSF